MDITASLIERLLEQGSLSADGLEHLARLRSSQSETPVPDLLSRLGLVSEGDLAAAWSSSLGWPRYSGQPVTEIPEDLPALPLRFLKHYAVVPVGFTSDNALEIVSSKPSNDYPFKAIEYATGFSVRPLVGLQSEVEHLIEHLYGQGRTAMGSLTDQFDHTAQLDDIDHLKDLASEAPVIKLVNLILQRAVEMLASDVHIEPFENRLNVRYRVDGLLRESESPPVSSAAAVISRIKIMAKLDIAERRLPQDGRITFRVQGRQLDLRVSTLPTSFGESVVMRLLDRGTLQHGPARPLQN